MELINILKYQDIIMMPTQRDFYQLLKEYNIRFMELNFILKKMLCKIDSIIIFISDWDPEVAINRSLKAIEIS